eukprot:4407638-Amphidinium_carterae.1
MALGGDEHHCQQALPDMHPDLVHEPPPEELLQILTGDCPERRKQEVVYTGSKFRFFRDGGGLPSPGHIRPSRQVLGVLSCYTGVVPH